MVPTSTEMATVAAVPRARSVNRLWFLFALSAALWAYWMYAGFTDWRPTVGEKFGRFALGFAVYLAAAKASLGIANRHWRSWMFALCNYGGFAMLLDWHEGKRQILFLLSAYLLIVSLHYVVMRKFAKREGWLPWAAFVTPIVVLIAIRHFSLLENALRNIPGLLSGSLLALFVGISYMTFRLSHLVVEVRNGVVEQPTFSEYLGYAFFLPVMVVGPITPYSLHRSSIENPSRELTPIGTSLARILVGAMKYQFLGNLLNQLSYKNLLLDGHPHLPVDLVIAAFAYHFYLYCNFSGFCDMAIGAAGLLGIRVKENFRNPFAARSVQEYWTRWHITLSQWMRDLVFSPLSKFLVQRFGPKNIPHAIAISIAVVFLLVGVWHGVGWHYALFGAAHSGALVIHHYYTLWLKRRLSKQAFVAYHANRWVNAASIAVTFVCTSSFLFLFANDLPTMKKILAAIQF